MGALSQRHSRIAAMMQQQGISALDGFFVSDMVTYTREDSMTSDAKNGTNYTDRWSPDINYVYIPIISGMGRPVQGGRP